MSRREPDFDLTLRLRNNHLLAWREKMGLTQIQAATYTGIRRDEWAAFENLRRSPVHLRWGGWNKDALKISEALGVSPEKLWPDAVQAVRQPVVRRQLDGPEAMAFAAVVGPRAALLPGPEEVAETNLMHRAFDKAMTTCLTPRERIVLTMRWGLDGQGERDLEETGTVIGVTRERCRQIELKALRKLNHSSSGLRARVRELGYPGDYFYSHSHLSERLHAD